MLEIGTKAPDFELPDQNGEVHKLSDYAGKKVISYFYPKDNTPGCTKQACGFSERYPQLSHTMSPTVFPSLTNTSISALHFGHLTSLIEIIFLASVHPEKNPIFSPFSCIHFTIFLT